MLVQEKQTEHAVAFKVDISDMTDAKDQMQQEPEVKKRLEAQAKMPIHSISSKDINQKLQQCEMRRRISHAGPDTNAQLEKVAKRKKSQDQAFDSYEKEHYHEEVDLKLQQAEEKRKAELKHKKQKVRQHMEKVEGVLHESKMRSQEFQQLMQDELDMKMESAAQKRQEQLEHIKQVAHQSGEKKVSQQHLMQAQVPLLIDSKEQTFGVQNNEQKMI